MVAWAVFGLWVKAGFAEAGRSAPSERAGSVGLPAPSGPYAIGRRALDLVDPQRGDAFSAEPERNRELMVYVWYPARPGSLRATAEYLPGARQLEADPAARDAMRDEIGSRWREVVSGAIRSHAMNDAEPARRSGGFPVVLFSHGASATTFSYTAQIEDLVSHGYVVVAIEHTDAAGVVLFPNGQVRLYREPRAPVAGAAVDPMQAMIASAEIGTQTGAEDLRFVLDVLMESRERLQKVMNFAEVAAVGHSAGGTLTLRACQIDPRIRVCVSEDGSVNPVGAYFDYPGAVAPAQPVLFLDIAFDPNDEMLARLGETRAQWNGFLAHSHGQMKACGAGSYRVILSGAGMGHGSFSDGPLLNAKPGSKKRESARKNLLLAEELLRQFLEKHLRDAPAPMLDQRAEMPAGVLVERVGKRMP